MQWHHCDIRRASHTAREAQSRSSRIQGHVTAPLLWKSFSGLLRQQAEEWAGKLWADAAAQFWEVMVYLYRTECTPGLCMCARTHTDVYSRSDSCINHQTSSRHKWSRNFCIILKYVLNKHKIRYCWKYWRLLFLLFCAQQRKQPAEPTSSGRHQQSERGQTDQQRSQSALAETFPENW